MPFLCGEREGLGEGIVCVLCDRIRLKISTDLSFPPLTSMFSRISPDPPAISSSVSTRSLSRDVLGICSVRSIKSHNTQTTSTNDEIHQKHQPTINRPSSSRLPNKQNQPRQAGAQTGNRCLPKNAVNS